MNSKNRGEIAEHLGNSSGMTFTTASAFREEKEKRSRTKAARERLLLAQGSREFIKGDFNASYSGGKMMFAIGRRHVANDVTTNARDIYARER